MPNAQLYESQAGIKIARRNINNLRYVDDCNGRKWRGTKILEEGEKKQRESWLETQYLKN